MSFLCNLDNSSDSIFLSFHFYNNNYALTCVSIQIAFQHSNTRYIQSYLIKINMETLYGHNTCIIQCLVQSSKALGNDTYISECSLPNKFILVLEVNGSLVSSLIRDLLTKMANLYQTYLIKVGAYLQYNV